MVIFHSYVNVYKKVIKKNQGRESMSMPVSAVKQVVAGTVAPLPTVQCPYSPAIDH